MSASVPLGDDGSTVQRSLRRFVELFNDGRHWDSHEVLEDLWREQRSDFLQGLILYASAFVHVRRGNRHGILAQLSKAETKLSPYSPHYLGIGVDGVRAEIERVQKIVRAHLGVRPEDWSRLVSYPQLTIEARWMRGDEVELGTHPNDE